MTPEQKELLQIIDTAFDGVLFPGPAHLSLYQAEAEDDRECCSQERDHKGRWQSVPEHQMLECEFALPHLKGPSLHYYLPAIMSFAVRTEDLSDHLFQSLEFHLKFVLDDEGLYHYGRKRHALFTPGQFQAVARFSAYYGTPQDDVARWDALGRGEDWPPFPSKNNR
jgi:hypothetical protein